MRGIKSFWTRCDELVVDPKKVEHILDYKAPRDVWGIKGFIGMAGYYRRFIEGFLRFPDNDSLAGKES
jgi:hypothetical protein